MFPERSIHSNQFVLLSSKLIECQRNKKPICCKVITYGWWNERPPDGPLACLTINNKTPTSVCMLFL